MDATAASNERAQFIREACVFFRSLWKRNLVRVSGHGKVCFHNASDRLHWQQLHESADAVVRRYYRSRQSPF